METPKFTGRNVPITEIAKATAAQCPLCVLLMWKN